jgi:hypothetical protein
VLGVAVSAGDSRRDAKRDPEEKQIRHSNRFNIVRCGVTSIHSAK